MYCTACELECEVEDVDFGVGAYEYWGAPGFHTDVHTVSKCCEAELSEVPPSLTEPDPNLIPADLVAG